MTGMSRFVPLAATVIIAACGGGGGGGSSSGYTIGGNLTGLASGQHITLQNNGANPLTLTSGGTFTFSAQITYGSAYSVTVSSQPSQQFCSVQNGIGTIGSAVTNVQVDCYTESILYNFTSGDSGKGAYPGE